MASVLGSKAFPLEQEGREAEQPGIAAGKEAMAQNEAREREREVNGDWRRRNPTLIFRAKWQLIFHGIRKYLTFDM